MYDFNAFVEDKNYLYGNMVERHDIKIKNMPRFANSKSKVGAFNRSQKYHFIKPMMSRHGNMINLVMSLKSWTKNFDDNIISAIQTIANCYSNSTRSKDLAIVNDIGDLGWALKDFHNAHTSWEKFTVKRAFQVTGADLDYTNRRRLLNMIPQSIRTMSAWDDHAIFYHKYEITTSNEDANLVIKSHPINGEFVQAYKYRILEDRRLRWFHSGLAAEFVKSHSRQFGSTKIICTLSQNDLILFKKMSLVNDVKILGGWVKAMKDLHPVNVGGGLVNAVKTFIADGYRMGLPGYQDHEPRLTNINYENMSVLEMINASVNNHRVMAEINRLTLERYSIDEIDREMPTLALPEHLEDLRIKTSQDMRSAGNECGHCIGSYSQDNHHIFFRKGNICAMVSMTSGNIVQCFDRNNKNTAASKRFQSYLTTEIKKADIPFLRTIKKKVIPAEYFNNNEVRYAYPF